MLIFFLAFQAKSFNSKVTILPKVGISDDFESHHSVEFSLINIRGFLSNLLVVNYSLKQTFLVFLFYVRQSWNT